MIPWTCARWSESTNFAHVRRHDFAWRGPDDANNSFSYLSTRCCTDGSILLLSCTLTVGIKLHVVKLYKQNDLKWSLTRNKHRPSRYSTHSNARNKWLETIHCGCWQMVPACVNMVNTEYRGVLPIKKQTTSIRTCLYISPIILRRSLGSI